MSKLSPILLSLVFSLWLYSISSSAEERSGKAVFEISSELGMRLTDKALKNIEVKTVELDTSSNHSVPVGSLVHFQDLVGVYRLRQDWFKLVEVQIFKKSDRLVIIRSSELQMKDKIVIYGTDLLRVAEMDAFGSGE